MIKSEEVKSPTSCLNQSQDDEPLFVLCARDVSAPAGVRAWALAYQARGGRPEKVAEALSCATRMEEWRKARGLRIQAAVGALSPEDIAAVNSARTSPEYLEAASAPTVTESRDGDSDVSWQHQLPQTD